MTIYFEVFPMPHRTWLRPLLAGALALTLAVSGAPALALDAPSVTFSAAPSLFQSQRYTFTMDAGTLTVTAELAPGMPAGLLLLTAVDDPDFRQPFQPGADGKINAALSLPAGQYVLNVLPNTWRGLTLSAPSLQVKEAPVVTLNTKPFADVTDGLTLQPAVQGADPNFPVFYTSLSGEHGEFVKNADGSYQPVTLSTAGLPDGLHIYAVAAVADGQLGIYSLPVLVDRADSFADLPKWHWARRYIEVGRHLGLINGRTTDRYEPAENVTRAEFAKLLACALQLADGPSPFADTQGHWAAGFVGALAARGIVNGDLVEGQRYFYPEQKISRQEAAAMLARAFRLEAGSSTPTFRDWNEVEPWAQGPVGALVERQWLSGFPDGTFQPKALLKRDQAAKLIGMTLGM
jgi:hypothetical protein